MAVSKRLRFEILRRDNHACRYCGATAPDAVLTIDHVVPTALGGDDEPSNLVTACRDCNSGKTSMPADAALIDDVSADAVRWAAAMKQVAAIRAQELEDRRELMSWFNMLWCEWTNWRNEPFDAPDGAFLSIPDFIAAGLTRDELSELLVVAMRSQASDKWRYFCGCCWKRIRQNQELAAQIVNGPDADHDVRLEFSTCWTQQEIDEVIDRGVELLAVRASRHGLHP
jgi:hypothetical protein